MNKNENFSTWLNDVIDKAGILDIRYPVKGTYVWQPYGFKLRARVLKIIRGLLDEKGHEEALFPLLIPEDEFMKEAIHVKGFEEEVYWVTHGGLSELNVKLAIRPTSETAVYPMFNLWIRSHADLPIKIYQIVNTFRYETKSTRPLIRLREITTFKEAHTAHSSYEDAEKQAEEAKDVYKTFFDTLGIPYMISKRPEWDKFPGADYTIAFDTLLPDGKALQIGTIHNLGINFAKTFDIKFENPEGEQEYAYQTCYGISDRAIASHLAVHGDDKGLSLMPSVAPIQVVLIPIVFKGKEEKVLKAVDNAEKELREFRLEVDRSEGSPGNKFYRWEQKGVPLRVEIGPRDADNNNAVIVRRRDGEKRTVEAGKLKEEVKSMLEEIDQVMMKKAWQDFAVNIHEETNIEDALLTLNKKGGIIRTWWCGEEACGKEIEEITGAKLLGTTPGEEGTCLNCSSKTRLILSIAKTY